MADVTTNGITLHVQTLGAGSPTVVFLHGLVMDNLSSWYFTAGTRVGQVARAVLLDLRGHGRSERPASGYRVDDLLADLHGVLDAVAPDDPVVIVGNSFGGQLGVAYALAHPERVAGLVLVDAHLGGAGWGDRMAATLSLQGEERDAMIARNFESWLGRHSERKRNRLAERAKALVQDTSLVADLQASPPITDAELATLTCPMLAMYGEASDIIDDAARLQGLVPHARIRVFPGATHSLLWEATEDVVAAIVGWVTGDRSDA